MIKPENETSQGRVSRTKKVKNHSKTVDDFLAKVPGDIRVALERLRNTIKSVIPGSEEVISYQVPAFKFKGKLLVGYGATRNECSFYTMTASLIPEFTDKLKKYDTTKSAIHFLPDKPLPAALIKQIVKARIAQIDKK